MCFTERKEQKQEEEEPDEEDYTTRGKASNYKW